MRIGNKNYFFSNPSIFEIDDTVKKLKINKR